MDTFNEANAKLTNELTGRTIDHVIRNGKEIEMVCNDGHVVVIQADIHGDIHHKQTNVKVILPTLSLFGKAGKF